MNIDKIIKALPDAEIVDMIAIQEGKEAPAIDMLIAAGGDNFFQICTHYFPEAYLVGVNSDPETSDGALLNFTYDTLDLEKLLKKDFSAEEWTRISTYVNENPVEDATCTVALSIKATDMMSRYLLKAGNESEEQKSTGILVVSGAGSGDGAWYRNAGLYLPQIKSGLYPKTTQEFPKTSKQLRTLTREPMGAENCKYRWLNLVGDNISLMYWAADPSELSIDSVHRYEVKQGDKLRFSISDKPLKIVTH